MNEFENNFPQTDVPAEPVVETPAAPAFEAPAAEAPAFEAPVPEAPAFVPPAAPVYEAPAAPAEPQPAYQAPQFEQPQPAYQAPPFNQAPQQPYQAAPQFNQPFTAAPAGGRLPSKSKEKLVAGLLAIFLGALGIHKFYLGYTKAGIIMVLVSVIGALAVGIGPGIMAVIGLVEGIMYLTKSDEDFDSTYVVGDKAWF